MKKSILLLMIVALIIPVFGVVNAQDPVEVTILGTIKGEIGEPFEEAVAAYNASQDQYEIVSVPMDGSNPVEKMTTLYASGNATTMMVMGQEFGLFQENLLDLSDAEFSQHALPGTQDLVTVDGAIYGMPVTVEAFGLLYNKAVLDEAVGGDFDPASIQTRTDLRELFEQVQALDGVEAIHVSPMDWSLGAHFTNILFSPQSADREERFDFYEAIQSGDVSLMDNEVFNGWLDTLDLMLEFNANARSPLSPDYDQGTLALANGEAGFWFMGNWAYPQLVEINPDVEFGILPVPISDDAATYGNTQISVGVPLYIVIDESQSSPEEQAGAIDFLNWLISSEDGQNYYVNEFNFIPVYDTFEIAPADSMSRQILSFVEAGETLEWMNMQYPPDGWPSMGASMQKYLVDQVDRGELAEELEDYWANVSE